MGKAWAIESGVAASPSLQPSAERKPLRGGLMRREAEAPLYVAATASVTNNASNSELRSYASLNGWAFMGDLTYGSRILAGGD